MPTFAPRAAALAMLTALALVSPRTAADEPATSASPPDAEVRLRLSFLERRLEQGTAAADRWWYGWFTGFTALTTIQAVAAIATTNPGLRRDAMVGAVTSSLGVIPLGFFPLPARFAAADLRARPEATAAQRLGKLARAERLLADSARVEAMGHAWYNHVLSVGVSLGAGLVLALGYGRRATGALTAAAGVAVVEMQIFTEPTAAVTDLREYRALTFREGSAPSATARPTRPTWTLVPSAGGLGVQGSF